MIVRSLGDSLLLVTQPDHARLAGHVMSRATALASHPRRESILLAVAEHDNGWAEPDADPVIGPSGDVADFISAPIAVRHGVWPRAVAQLDRDPWAAALVAQHAVTVYDRFRADDGWTQFFATMTTLRDGLLSRAALGPSDLLADYAFVRLGDLISLTFCTGWTTPQQYAAWTVQRRGDTVLVAPDLFGGETIHLDIEGTEIPRRPYQSDQDLREEIAKGRIGHLTGMVSPGGTPNTEVTTR
jgi:hypothetical protein